MFPKLARVTQEGAVAEVTVESKSYIMARIRWNFRSTNLYWQLVDPAFSLLELGFEWPTGRLVDCSVPLFNGDIEDRRRESIPDAVPGTPLFDLSHWTVNPDNPAARGNHLEQPGRLRLVKKDGGLSIIVRDARPLRSVLYADRMMCDFDESDELVALTLRGSFSI